MVLGMVIKYRWLMAPGLLSLSLSCSQLLRVVIAGTVLYYSIMHTACNLQAMSNSLLCLFCFLRFINFVFLYSNRKGPWSASLG